MLPKSKRLNLKKDFKWVSSGRRVDTKYMKLFFKMRDPSTRLRLRGRSDSRSFAVRLSSPSKSRSGPRVGVAVSSQVFKKATQRSRAKRLVSAAFQSTIYHLPSTINIVALPKAGILGVKSVDVILDLEQALKHENIIT